MAKPPLRPPSRCGGPNTKTMLTWAFFLLLAAAVQSQSIHHSHKGETLIASARTPSPVPGRRSQAGRSPPEIPLLKQDSTTVKFRSTDDSQDGQKFRAVAPAQNIDAVGAPLAQSVGSSTGLPALSQARLLQDWEAENIVLLATIDGAIHARDRKTGQERWSLGIPDSQMVETIHHCNNKSQNGDDASCDHDYIFIVEPSKDGIIYMHDKDPRIGLQRLPFTVKDLAAETPRFIEESHLVTIAAQETTAFVIDAASGNILQQFNKQSAFVNDNQERSCRRLSGFELDDTACESFGTLNLGRVEYLVKISNTTTSELLCTIKFSEWIPNRRDVDLQLQYVEPLDSQHIQTYYNGRIIGLDTNSETGKFHRFTQMLDSPVARVFDIVRKVDEKETSPKLVLLSRPIDSPRMSSINNWRNDLQRTERVFVNRTENGMWYAMSELSYPGVTSGAAPANSHWNYDSTEIDFENNVDDIVGVHVLSADRSYIPPVRLTIEGRAPVTDLMEEGDKSMTSVENISSPAMPAKWGSDWSMLLNVILLSIFICAAGIQFKIPAMLKLQSYLRKAGIDINVHAGKVRETAVSSTPAEGVPIAVVDDHVQDENVSDILAEVIDSETITPARSRAQSTATTVSSPIKKQGSMDEEDNNSSDGDSDEEKVNSQGNEIDGTENGPAPRRRHAKRGKRGGRKNKKKKTMDPDAMDELDSLTAEVPTKDGLLQVGRLRLDTREEKCLGRGSNGTAVFPGTLDGREVAVKRLIRTANSLAAKEIKHLLSSDENPHVIRYFGKEESQHFTYIALDLFTTSLDQFVEKPLQYPDLVKLPEGYDVKDCLRQITDGVAHLHSLKLVHRDIKPQNVLVKAVRSNRPASGLPKLQFVISDFGLCKPLEEGPESTFAPTANHTAAGTTGWRAPELLVHSRAAVAAPNANSTASKSTIHSSDGTVIDPPSGRRATKAIDIFSLGCVFYYVMTQGRHPFDIGGTSLGRDLNIKENNFSTDDLRLHEYQFDADDLIMQMLKHDPKERPDTTGVLNHPYFWDVADKLEFICDVSDCYEKEKNSIKDYHNDKAIRTPAELESLAELSALESLGPNVIGPSNDFHRALPRSFINEMGKQRKYTGSKMIDLLRVIRNKKNHFHDLPEDVKEQMLGGSARGYYEFWVKRFPSLLINCHCVILERNLVERFRMERYYP